MIQESKLAISVRLKDKIAALKVQMQAFKTMEAEVHAAPDQQISLTDPDARAMGTSGKEPPSSATMCRPPSMRSTT